MDKKIYIKPEIDEVDIEVVEMLALSFDLEDEGGDDSSLTNKYRPGRRGRWGDLWYVEN